MDISMDDRYAEICGISEKEIHTYFEEDICELATATKKSYEETCKELQINYNGYHFTENAIGMYNPFSLLNTFAKKDSAATGLKQGLRLTWLNCSNCTTIQLKTWNTSLPASRYWTALTLLQPTLSQSSTRVAT